MRIESGSHFITTLNEWERWAPPKAREHWKPERSAYELARAWCGTESPAMPDAVKEVLDSRPETRGLAVEVAYPERRIPFDSLKGEPCKRRDQAYRQPGCRLVSRAQTGCTAYRDAALSTPDRHRRGARICRITTRRHRRVVDPRVQDRGHI